MHSRVSNGLYEPSDALLVSLARSADEPIIAVITQHVEDAERERVVCFVGDGAAMGP